MRLAKFEPSRDLWYLAVGWLAVVTSIYVAFQVFTTRLVALNFIFFGVIGIAAGGVGFPVYVNCIVRRRPLSDLGVGSRGLRWSLGLGLLLAAIQYSMTLRNAATPDAPALVPLVAMSLAVTLYEAIFFRGFAQQRLEECFGLIPSLLLGAAMYALYHIGYGMTPQELPPLFWVGLVYATVFRLTRNITIIWPLLSPMGALYAHVRSGLVIPFAATYGFLDSLLLMLGILIWAALRARKISAPPVDNVK